MNGGDIAGIDVPNCPHATTDAVEAVAVVVAADVDVAGCGGRRPYRSHWHMARYFIHPVIWFPFRLT